MIELRDRPRLITDLIVAELLSRPGTRGPLARPVWGRPVAPTSARTIPQAPQQPPAAGEPGQSER